MNTIGSPISRAVVSPTLARRQMLKWVCGILWPGALMGCNVEQRPSPDRLPAIDLPTLGGGLWRSRDHVSPMLVNFWATWCGPCRGEMASLEQLHRSLASTGVLVVGISIDRDSRLAEEFWRAQKLTFLSLHDAGNHLTGKLLQIRTLPTTLVVNADREIVDRVERAEDWSASSKREILLRQVGIQQMKVAR